MNRACSFQPGRLPPARLQVMSTPYSSRPLTFKLVSRPQLVFKSISASSSNAGGPSDEDVDGLLPEEDSEIQGTYRDAMSGNTPLGKAVRSACDELDALGALELETLNAAEALLKSAGFKGSLFAVPEGAAAEDGGNAAEDET